MAHIVGIRGDIVQGFQGDPIRRIYSIWGFVLACPQFLETSTYVTALYSRPLGSEKD